MNASSSVPNRIFLDTNVVNLIVDYEDYIFQDIPLLDGILPSRRVEVESLGRLFDIAERACWSFVVSSHTRNEIMATPDEMRRSSLDSLFAEAWYVWCENADESDANPELTEPISLRIGQDFAHVLAVLPDESDRKLLCDAIAAGCDCFCTDDRRTILKHRDKMRDLPLKIVRPSDWWVIVENWLRV